MLPVVGVLTALEWGKNAIISSIKWLALRALLITLILTLFPIAIYKGWLLIQEKIMTYISGNMTGDIWSGSIVQLTGLAGWLADNLKFQQCFSLLVSAMAFRFIIGFFHK